MQKKCATPDCGLKDLSEFYSDRTRHDRKCQYCKVCFKKRQAERREREPQKLRETARKSYFKVKRQVMDQYGSVCQCCGEHRIEFLTLDHKHQNGADHRREIGYECSGYNFYLWLRKNGWPKNLGLQVLCANCNTARGAFGVCPHELERGE